MDWILCQIDFFQKLKFLILSNLSAGLSFQTDALGWISDWLPGRKRHPGWLLAPSSKHQFENLPGPLLEHLHPKTKSISLFQPFWNWFLFIFRSMLLTDVGYPMCWWQVLDIGQVANATNILVLSPTKWSPRSRYRFFKMFSKSSLDDSYLV